MRLMTRDDILRSVETPGGPLQIGNFSKEQLEHSAYYVRLGSLYHRRSEGLLDEPYELTDQQVMLGLKPGEYVTVTSYEHFRLEATVLGIMGNIGSVARHGVAVVNGQFIDPLFPSSGVSASLEFGVKNENFGHGAIRYMDPIVKVAFFDVSDSGPMTVEEGSYADRAFSNRIRAMDAQFKRVK